MTANVPRMEKGSASAGMSVADPLCRNRKITPTTSTSVMSIVDLDVGERLADGPRAILRG